MNGADGKKKMRRKARILELLAQNETLTPQDLTGVLAVSASTIRRDLEEMAEAGVIKRRFGHVETLTLPGEEAPFALRETVNHDEKMRIARAALELVENGETIFIAGGTTNLEFARLLPGNKRLTVITHALRVANLLVEKPGIELILLGGSVLPDEQILLSPIGQAGAPEFRANKLFYGTQAVSLRHGLTHSRVAEVSTERMIAGMVDQIILLVDHTKFGKTAPVFVMPLSAINCVVTGKEVDRQVPVDLQQQGIRYLLV